MPDSDLDLLLSAGIKSSSSQGDACLILTAGRIAVYHSAEKMAGAGGLPACFQEDFTAMPHIVLSTVHVVLQISKCQLRLNHPELRQMAGRVAVLCPARQVVRASQVIMCMLSEGPGKHHSTSR